jgi:hypothetical protein
MKKVNYFCIACLSILFFGSCAKKVAEGEPPPTENPQPENPQPENPIVRKWNFVSMEVKQEYKEEWTEGIVKMKKIKKSEYLTLKNGGSCTFDKTKATSENLTYEVSATEKIDSYRNDTLIGTIDSPLTFTVSHTGHISDYNLVGSDSLRMNSGPIIIKPNGIPQLVTVKLRYDNDKLYMTYRLSGKTTSPTQVVETESADVVITLKKN